MKINLFVFLIFCFQISLAQEVNIVKLNDKIYEYNNNLEYKKSQDTLLHLLSNENLTAHDQIEINILLSMTYKRLQDYKSVLLYLSDAKKIALENKLVVFEDEINAQFAFAFFDTQNYKEADKIMKKIALDNYRNLNSDSKSKILMQQGFIEFLDSNYEPAENFYKKASGLMQKDNHCDLPIVFGKQIQLYFATKEFEKANNYYKKGIEKAKECHIIKYEIYLAEVMMNIYKDRKDATNTFKFQKKYDSLTLILKPAENLQELHFDREIKSRDNEQKEKKYWWITVISYTIALLLLFIIIILVLRYSFKLKRINKAQVHTIGEMRTMVTQYEFNEKTNVSNLSLLNKRQLSIIDMIKDGKSYKEIANQLHVSENTIKYHIKIIYDILNIKKRSQLKDFE